MQRYQLTSTIRSDAPSAFSRTGAVRPLARIVGARDVAAVTGERAP